MPNLNLRGLCVASVTSVTAGMVLCIAGALVTTAAPLPTLEEALAARRDVYGEAAMAQPNGASYEFLAPLMPPPRYVHADFRYYPLVLSAPNASVKARLISNGSGVNLPGGSRSWHDVGVPFTFRVGPDEFLFGGLAARLSEPTLADGFLPIPEIRYRHATPLLSEGAVPLTQEAHRRPAEIYALEAFASTDPALADHAVVFARFSLAQGTSGTVTVGVADKTPVTFADGRLTDASGGVVAIADGNWKWERQRLQARITAKQGATIAFATKPLAAAAAGPMRIDYDAQRAACVETWRSILRGAMNVETPEPLVNNAWRHLLLQNFQLIKGDRMHYSAGNQYDQLYEAEGSDAALAMMMWGYEADMRRLLVPLLDFTRKGLEYHQAGFKLNDVCRYFWQTRDAGTVRALRPRWEKELRRLVDNRTGPHGLFPAERYTGDISTPAQTLTANSKAWRAMRDVAAMLAELGETAEADRQATVAREFRQVVLAAVEKSVNRTTSPPFVPAALYSDEPAHDPILHSRIGSYWNITMGYSIASGIFPPGSEQETWIPRYQEQHGGIFMGMIRSGGGDEFNFWTGTNRINPLYGTRYTLDALRRDEAERALVSFYGMLAQGFTRNTFVCGEGCTLLPVDDGGRFFYCPPNSAANGHFLSMLRTMLVQDWDLDDDGRPETLRLLFATPKRWLADGQAIKVERAPTPFGAVSVTVQSKLSAGEVVANVTLPEREKPKQALLRIRVPDGWRVVSAERAATAADGGRAARQTFAVDPLGTADISALEGEVAIRFKVAPAASR